MANDLKRRKDGSYVLKHKSKQAKKGVCTECGQNEKSRELGLLYRHKSEDNLSVQEYISNHLRDYKKHKSVTPVWCSKCKALIEYFVEVDIDQTLGYYEKAD
tara:strand:- start:358 stop:663 length:306 start_codon:yes stop_codon:yes gene_type:complete